MARKKNTDNEGLDFASMLQNDIEGKNKPDEKSQKKVKQEEEKKEEKRKEEEKKEEERKENVKKEEERKEKEKKEEEAKKEEIEYELGSYESFFVQKAENQPPVTVSVTERNRDFLTMLSSAKKQSKFVLINNIIEQWKEDFRKEWESTLRKANKW